MDQLDQFPQMLYKAGGPEQIHGGAFSTLVVHDAEEHAAALKAGWHESTPDAVAVKQAEQQRAAREAAEKLAEQAKAAAANDNAPPTREELEQKAAELGIKFAANVGDKKLAERIAEKLAEQA